ncbi:hypothetical protein LCGC14_2344780 [marine sediment metagenome]|uniref:Lipoprotein n=1 Tax=marine sediment metagenome TaxID=412755 RepID=A0A0F9F623_9ZZZZ
MEHKNLLLASLILFVSGCQLGQVEGVSASLGSFERGLWYDHDRRDYHENGWGLKLDIVAGHMIRPVPKFWLKDQNIWKGDQPWFVIRVPMVAPYLGLALGRYGVYAGTKTFLVGDKHRSLARYGKWMREREFPADPNGTMTYLQLSGSIRRTRWK